MTYISCCNDSYECGWKPIVFKIVTLIFEDAVVKKVSNNCANIVYEYSELFHMIQSNESICFQEVKGNMRDEKGITFKFVDGYKIMNMKEHFSKYAKTSRKVPNILKNSLRLNKNCQVNETELNWFFKNRSNVDQDAQDLVVPDNLVKYNRLENVPDRKENKCKRVSNNRKQKFNPEDVWHDLPDCNVSSLMNDKEDKLDKHILIPPKVKTYKQQEKKVKRPYRKRNKKPKEPAINSKQKEVLPPSKFQHISTDFENKCETFSSLSAIESTDFSDTIDFSSNVIFSKFNYEFYANISSDCPSWHMMSSDEIHDSFSSMLDTDSYEKGCDINGNEINMYKSPVDWSPHENKETEKIISAKESLLSSEHLNESTLVFTDKKSKTDSFCNQCFEDYTSNWFTINKIQSSIYTDDTLLGNIFNDDSNIDSNCQSLNTAECKIHLIGNILEEKKNRRTSMLVTANENSSNPTDDIDSLLKEFIDEFNEDNIDVENIEEVALMKLQEECNLLDDSYDGIDYDGILEKLDKEAENVDDTEVSGFGEKVDLNANKEGLQCSLCSLTFSNTRTMAMHQAGAHGGTYVILCECCGRLFNRKYHFNRHFVYCRRLKEPVKCDLCAKKYRYKSSLVHHLKVEHDVNNWHKDSTILTCSICQKNYNKFGAFENHLKTHKNTW